MDSGSTFRIPPVKYVISRIRLGLELQIIMDETKHEKIVEMRLHNIELLLTEILRYTPLAMMNERVWKLGDQLVEETSKRLLVIDEDS